MSGVLCVHAYTADTDAHRTGREDSGRMEHLGHCVLSSKPMFNSLAVRPLPFLEGISFGKGTPDRGCVSMDQQHYTTYR